MKGVHAILSVVLLCAAATVSNAATPPGFEPESTISLFPERPTRVWQIDWSGSETKPMPLHAALAHEPARLSARGWRWSDFRATPRSDGDQCRRGRCRAQISDSAC